MSSSDSAGPARSGLLDAATPGAATPGRRARRSVVPYDFRRPNKVSREHVRALEIANETFARQFSTVLSTTLRTLVQVSLAGVGQQTYDEYVQDMPNPSYLAVLALEPLTGHSLLHVPLDLVMRIVDRLLGGEGRGEYAERPLTDIEDALVRRLVARALRELGYAYESLVRIEPRVTSQESNPQFAQITSPSDMVVVASFEVRIGDRAGDVTLCIPFASLEPVLETLQGQDLGAGRSTADPRAVRDAIGHRFADVAVEVSVRFPPVPLTAAEIVGLRPGDVVPLRHAVGSPLAVAVAGVPRFSGLAGRHGARLACLIVEPPTKESP